MHPNFFVVGAQKAATTSLQNYLISHPEIYLPPQKETKFFVDNRRYIKGIEYYQDTFFSSVKNEKAIGEIDPDYIYFECAIQRIAKNYEINKLKFIFVFRNPIDRAFSHYLMTYRRGLEKYNFEKAINMEQDRIKNDYDSKMHFSYLERGFYYTQLQQFLKYIDKSQMYFLLSEDLRENTNATLQGIYKFLGVASNFTIENSKSRHHEATIPRSMEVLNRIKKETIEKKIMRALIPSRKIRDYLRHKLIEWNQTHKHNLELKAETQDNLAEYYKEQSILLADFIDRDLSSWYIRK